MIVLITGYPDSGKSALAEERAAELSGGRGLIYLATMIPFGEEGRERIKRHRQMREGKGFETIEAPFDICAVLAGRYSAAELESKTVLLECVSNLAANEMFERHTSAAETIDRLSQDIRDLAASVLHLVAVTNHYEITESFDEETKLYSETLDRLNEKLAGSADETVTLK